MTEDLAPQWNKTILIVDDTPENLRLLSNMLIKQGYKVRSAISGPMALKTVQVEVPDLILLDIKMPHMDGYEVCQHLKADPQTCDVPVIFLSAYSEVFDKVKAFKCGGVDYISKPFQLEEVIVRIETQLRLRQAQLELQEAKAQALRSLAQEKELNRMKTDFVSMISHDFRTPLASIQGFAGLLRHSMNTLPDDQKTRYFNKIDAAVEHLLFLIEQVLLLGRLEATTVQCQPLPLHLEECCRELTDTLQLSAGERQQLIFRCSGDCSHAEMDEALLRQILINLLSNAIKYSAEGSEILFDLICENDVATFRIQDHGIGIPADDQAHIFETYFRCSNASQIRGTGLGLSVVKTCVEAHQGTLHVDSEVGRGTTVTVQLPLRRSHRL